MPAINLPRLRQQIAALQNHLDQPEQFWKAFYELLNFYTNRTARALPRTGDYLPTLHAPQQILREIELALAPQAHDAPQRITPLITRLWKENLLEAHLLAARLLGHIPTESDNWLDIVNAWLTATRDPRVRAVLLNETLRPLRRDKPAAYLRLIQNWLKGESVSPSWSYGLQALKFYLQESRQEDLPPVFALLAEVLPAAAPQIQSQLAEALNLLYQKSPAETRYFLRQTLPRVTKPSARRSLRRLAPHLPAALRNIIRQALQN